MKFLFSSSERTCVESFGKKAKAIGIACEIRWAANPPEQKGPAAYPELWLQNEDDLLQASALLVRELQGR